MLCIIMLMLNAQLFVFAVDETPPDAENTPDTAIPEATLPAETPSENPFELGAGELPYAQLQTLSPLDVALPETITRAQAIEKGHVNRLYAQEKTLGAVLYQNQNGTKTAYVFDKPVKYVDADGNIKDKNTTITATGIAGYAYAMTENSFSAYFGSTAANGVMIQYEDYAFSMKPETSLLVSTPTLGEDARSVIYNGAFGAQTALRYETQLSGVKEDIILMRNVGKYAFNFLLTTSGLTPVQKENGAWTLVNADQETVINFGSIVIKDSAGKTVYGTLNITPRASNGYIMTVTVPQAFLQASDTTYPVYVDPTTVVRETGQYIEYDGSDAIQVNYNAITDIGLYNDATLYQSAYSNTAQHYLSEGKGKIIYKFYDFYGANGQFIDLNPYRIGRVTLYLKSPSQIRSNISAYPMSSGSFEDNELYNSSNATEIHAINNSKLFKAYSETNSYACSIVSTYDESFSINITNIVRGWAKHNAGTSVNNYDNPNNGFVLEQSNSILGNSAIYSTEANGNSNVYYEIDYNLFGGHFHLRNSAAGKNLSYNSTSFSVTTSTDVNATWILDYCGNGNFIIRREKHINDGLSSNGSILPIGNNLQNFYYKIEAASGGGGLLKSTITGNVLCYNGSSVSMVSPRSASSSNYNQTVFYFQDASIHMLQSLEITNTEEWVAVGSTLQLTIQKTPTNAIDCALSSDIVFTSSNPEVATISSTGLITGLSNGYTDITISHATSNIKDVVRITVGQLIENGTYFVRNKMSNEYMLPTTLNVAGNVSDSPLKEQCWTFSYSNGYYTLKLFNQTRYLGVGTQYTNEGEKIGIVASTVSTTNRAQWKITYTLNGGFKFLPKTSEANNVDYVLSLNKATTYSATIQKNLAQYEYVDDALLHDEWYIYSDASLLAYNESETINRDFATTLPEEALGDATLPTLEAITGSETIYNSYMAAFSKQFIQQHMENSSIYVHHTHGSQQRFLIGNEIYYNIDDIMNSDLSQVNLIIFLTCSGGVGGYNENNVINKTPQNLVEACVAAGAKTVIAFDDETIISTCNLWIRDFFVELSTPKQIVDEETGLTITTLKTIREVVKDCLGDNYWSEHSTMDVCSVIGGDGNLTIIDLFDYDVGGI